jgi:DNA mismatch endonuclease (patch repair protein)
MLATRRRDTAAEVAIRAALEAYGLVYEVDRAILPEIRRRADLLFGRERVAAFVDGCFWHACPLHATWPKKNAAWWRAKIEANQQRDADTDRRLAEAGWAVIRVWEHEDPVEAATRIAAIVRERTPTWARCD